MPNTTEILPFGLGGGANVVSPATWSGATERSTGFQAGVALSSRVNTALRQASFITGMVAQWIVDNANASVLDNGDLAALETLYNNALSNSLADDIQNQLGNYAADTGTADALVVALSPVPGSAINSRPIRFTKGNAANATTTPTLVVNGLTARTIVKSDGASLSIGDLKANTRYEAFYDSANTVYRIYGGSLASDIVTAAPKTGRVSQVQQALRVGSDQSTNSGYVTGFSMTFTPVAPTSTRVIIAAINHGSQDATGVDFGSEILLRKTIGGVTTVLSDMKTRMYSNVQTNPANTVSTLIGIDSASASSVVYDVQHQPTGANETSTLYQGSNFIVMELAP